MRQFYFIAFLIFSLNSTMAQCPSIVMAMVNSCGTSEGLNEFVLFTTSTTTAASNYTFHYGTTNPPTFSTLSGSDAAPITGTGTVVSNGSCSVINVTSPATIIPTGSQVIIIPASFDQNYDITGLCNGNAPIYVIYVRTNPNGGSNSNWSAGGNLGNTPSTPRYLQVTVNGNSSCTSTSAPVSSYTAAGNWPSNTDGNFVYWVNNLPNYANNGCSILGLQTTGDTTVVACSSFSWHGNLYTSSTNTATYTTTNALGFDSIVTLHLTINQPTSSDTIATACNSFVWHNQTFTSSNNTVTFTTTNAVNCDSVVHLNLTINYSNYNAQTLSNCGPFDWHGTNYQNSGDYIYQYTNAAGCASADTLHLTINPITSTDTAASVCNSFVWHGTNYQNSGDFIYQYTNSSGCVSADTLHLTINQSTSSDTIATACNSFVWHNQTFTSSNNTAVFTTTNAVNCDSIVRLNLTINYGDFNGQNINSCGPYIWNGTNYQNSGDYIYQYSNASGCASADTLHLTIAQKPNLGPDKYDTICFGASVNLETYFPATNFSDNWTFHQTPINSIQHVTESGSYQLIRLVTSGCSDTANINLVVLPLLVANAGPDGIAAINYPYQLIGSGAGQYSWYPNSVLNNSNIANPIATIQSNTTFVLTITNDTGCIDTDTVYIKAIEGPQVYLPNAFTPNGDRLNDKIKPICVGISRFDYFRIFNRYGNLLFETNKMGEGWDGYYKGKRQSSGNYIATVKVKDVRGKEYIKTSNLLLIY